MEQQTFSFEHETGDMSQRLQAALEKTESALKKMWECEKREEKTVYEITIPTQMLTIFGKEHAEHVLRTLKGMKLTGTYRVTKK